MDNTPIDYKRWFEAARFRVSTRKYFGAPEEGELERLSLLAKALEGDGIRLKVTEATPKLFSGFQSLAIKNVTHVALIIGKEDSPLNRIGYKGEALTLEATAMGLATCWMAGTFKQSEARKIAELEDGEKLFGLISLGKPSEPFKEIPDSERGRKPLEKLVQSEKGMSLADIEPWQNSALKCARIAPSSVNFQPWRFACTKGLICMVASGLFSKKAELDLGIAMLHIDLGTAVEGVHGSWGRDGDVWVFTKANA
ncbi:MAG: nitroreductase family protein [Oscillospiraceae bacterium]|nr:nitroreductase family protein [Oscillospiraceae bacterium]